MKARHLSHLALALQAGIAACICYFFTSVILLSRDISTGTFFNALHDFIPSIVICISALITEIILMLKHKSHLTDREFLPFIFLMVTLQNVILIPRFYNYTGNYPIYYINAFMIGSRFIIIALALLFLFSSLTMIGAQLPKNSSITTISIIVGILIAAMLPNDTNYIISFGGSDIYNSVFIILIIIIYLLAFILNIFAIISNEVTIKNIKKNISFCFLIVANLFIVVDFNSYYLPIAGVVLFIISNIVLIASSNNY